MGDPLSEVVPKQVERGPGHHCPAPSLGLSREHTEFQALQVAGLEERGGVAAGAERPDPGTTAAQRRPGAAGEGTRQGRGGGAGGGSGAGPGRGEARGPSQAVGRDGKGDLLAAGVVGPDCEIRGWDPGGDDGGRGEACSAGAGLAGLGGAKGGWGAGGLDGGDKPAAPGRSQRTGGRLLLS